MHIIRLRRTKEAKSLKNQVTFAHTIGLEGRRLPRLRGLATCRWPKGSLTAIRIGRGVSKLSRTQFGVTCSNIATSAPNWE